MPDPQPARHIEDIKDNRFAKALREAHAAGVSGLEIEGAIDSIFSKRDYVELRLNGQGMIPFQIMLREGFGLKYVCTHRFDDLRQGDYILPHKNLGWFQVEEIWRPDGTISEKGCERMTLVAVVTKKPRHGWEQQAPEDGHCEDAANADH